MFRHNRNETNKNNNITPTVKGYKCNSACQNTCPGRNSYIPERDTLKVEPFEEGKSNDSFDNSVTRNPRRNPDEAEFFPRFIQRGAMHTPEFRATQITRIQTTIMDEDEEEEEDEECECPIDTSVREQSLPIENMTVRKARSGLEEQLLKYTKDSMLLKPNLTSNRDDKLPQFASKENELRATSAPFKPKRESVTSTLDEGGDPGVNASYMTKFGNLVTRQLDNLETRFIVYKVKMRRSRSLRAMLLKKKYLLLSIPLVLCLLWLVLLLGVLLGSVFCIGMDECPWAKGTTMAPRFLYSPHSVF